MIYYCVGVSDDMNDILCIRGNVTTEVFLICVWAPPAGHDEDPGKVFHTDTLDHRQNTTVFKVVGLYGNYSDYTLWKIFLLSKCIGMWGFKSGFPKWNKYGENLSSPIVYKSINWFNV